MTRRIDPDPRPNQIHPSVFIAEGAVVLGNVTLEEDASVWFGAVLRGDVDSISVGKRSNVQDLAVVHCDPGFPCVIGEDVTIGHAAVVLGNVTLEEDASVWFGAVLRGDVDSISVGKRSNIQDLAVVHCDPGFPCFIGEDVTIGHAAVVHGATIESQVLIGIRSVVLNGARVGKGSIIGAGAVVTEGAEIPPNSLVVGVPGKVLRQTTDQQRAHILSNALNYVQSNRKYRETRSSP